MYVGSYTESWCGAYYRYTSTFKISINSRTINDAYRRDCSNCWHNFVRSVTVHELGHVLDLIDNPVAPGKPPGYYLSIMAYNRDRNAVITPYYFDQMNVSSRY
ncbi:hypothetical protein SAMN05428934_101380 [Tessaracoccus flavus]|nr:hypothetical protein SAMN05428934_101380 [Tessaracoccus flavus]